MIYAIGDIQGCLEPLKCLLKQIDFRIDRDQLWLAGDLINRGPASLQTLRFCYQHRDNIVAVLGNHDLHLLAIHYDDERKPKRKDTLDEILAANDKTELLGWLAGNALLHWDEEQNAVMTHAGMPPMWNLAQAMGYAAEVQAVLANPEQRQTFFKNMYGNKPDYWDEKLSGVDRWRTIASFFTRMRVLDKKQHLNLDYKSSLQEIPKNHYPWFNHPQRKTISARILFGHWAALMGATDNPDIIGLDRGCVWGKQLAAYCLDNREWFFCDCRR